jgi:uncharacterized protein YbaA (DUF1428 family)
MEHGALEYYECLAESDPRLKMEMDKMPFDGKRMIWGGFKTMVAFGGKNGK